MDLPIEEEATPQPDRDPARPRGDADGGAGESAGGDENALSVGLMIKVKGGDQQAFEQLVVMHQGAVIGTVAKMLGDLTEAHDIAQQVFIRVWKSAPRYEPKAKFTTWLFTITRNLVFNETRRRGRRKTVSSDQREDDFHKEITDEGEHGPAVDLEKKELFDQIDQAIQSLPEKQRLAVVLRRYEDMPYDEIAKVLKTSISSVKSLLFRARTQLKAQLASYLKS